MVEVEVEVVEEVAGMAGTCGHIGCTAVDMSQLSRTMTTAIPAGMFLPPEASAESAGARSTLVMLRVVLARDRPPLAALFSSPADRLPPPALMDMCGSSARRSEVNSVCCVLCVVPGYFCVLVVPTQRGSLLFETLRDQK